MLSLLTLLLLLEPSAWSTRVRQSSSMARPCASLWNTPTLHAKKKRPKNAPNESQAGACIELSFSSLEIQEYLQSYSRSQHWTILEEHMTEDTWTFSLARSKDELLEGTNAVSTSGSEKMDWNSGIALVRVISTPLADGFTRTIIRANFRGYRENPDQFAMQQKYWDLLSNGRLESSILSAIKTHFKTSQ
jgi:hypothetical protein